MAHIQQVMRSEEYHQRATEAGRTRSLSHIEFGALIIQAGFPPTGITRVCRALRRLGIPHSEDGTETSQSGAIPSGVTALPKGSCSACRGRHRKHEMTERCSQARC